MELIGLAIDEGRRRLRQRVRKGKKGEVSPLLPFRRVHLSAAEDVLYILHGKPTQPVEVAPRVDLSGLRDKELDDFNRFIARVTRGDGAGGQT